MPLKRPSASPTHSLTLVMLVLGLTLLPLASSRADGRTAMVNAMQAMVDTMANFIGADSGALDGRLGPEFGNPEFGNPELSNRGLSRRLREDESDLTLLYRDMPGAAPRSSLSKTQLLDGIWLGRQGDVLMIRDGNARLFGYNRAFYESADISLQPTRLEIKSLSSGLVRTYDYAYRDGRLALRDAADNILLYRRQNRFSWNRWLGPVHR